MVGTAIVSGQIGDSAGVHRLRGGHAVRPHAKINGRPLLAVLTGGGSDMATASIEVAGPNAERLARELRAALMTAVQPGGSVSPVEVERSADLVIAIIGLALSGVGTAKTIWDWWHSRRSEGLTVKILLDDGTQVDLSGVDQERLEIALERRTPPKH
jgi:hypothetical protein